MKTKQSITAHTIAGMLACTCLFGGSIFAQTGTPNGEKPKTEQKETIRIKMIRNVDGKTVVVDTTFEGKSKAETDAFLKSMHHEAGELKEGEPGEKKIIMMNVDIDAKGDSARHMMMQQMSDEDIQKLMENCKDGTHPKDVKGTVVKKIVIDENGQRSEKTEVKTMKDGKWVNAEKPGEVMVLHDDMVITLVRVLIQDLSEKDQEIVNSILKPNSGIKNLDLQQISFYPNPNNGRFKLSFDTPTKKQLQVRILNLEGKEIYTDKPENFNGHCEKEIDISNNKKGVYILQVSQGKEQLNKKIVIE